MFHQKIVRKKMWNVYRTKDKMKDTFKDKIKSDERKIYSESARGILSESKNVLILDKQTLYMCNLNP